MTFKLPKKLFQDFPDPGWKRYFFPWFSRLYEPWFSEKTQLIAYDTTEKYNWHF